MSLLQTLGLGKSLDDRLTETGGRPTGFDYLRLTLSIAVVCSHSFLTSYGKDADAALWYSDLRPVLRLVLPMFFTLSGFLVAGSLLRCRTIGYFLGLRVIRIYPALAVEVLLSALLIGPLVTNVDMVTYFTDPKFWSYLLNVTGHIHYLLPGVFTDNPDPEVVNGQLWCVPFELYCYLTLAALAILGIVKRKYVGILAVLFIFGGYMVARMSKHDWTYPIIMGGVPGVLLIGYFVTGVTMYLYRDKIPFHPALGLLSAILSIYCLGYMPMGDFFASVPAAYLTIYLGLTSPKKLFFVKGADYSYGIYLYGFVIQQTLMHSFPALRHWYYNIPASLAVAVVVSALSWHLVEKRALEFKTNVKAIEDWYLKRRAAKQVKATAAVRTELD